MKTEDLDYDSLLAILKEAVRGIQETRRQFKEMSEQFKEMSEQFEKDRQETNRQFEKDRQETNRQFRETDKKINKVQGLFTTQWGKLVEAIVQPSCLKLFKDRGIDVSRTHRATTVEIDKIKKAEYDTILANGSEVVIVEVKTTLRVKDVHYFIEKLSKVKTYMPDYANKNIYGAMAAISFNTEAEHLVVKNGLFLIKSSGEGMLKIDNDVNFKPTIF